MQTRKKQQTALSRRLTNLPKDRAFFIVEFAPLSKLPVSGCKMSYSQVTDTEA